MMQSKQKIGANIKDKQTAVIGWYSESNFCSAYERKKVFVFFLLVGSFSAVVIVSVNAGCCQRDNFEKCKWINVNRSKLSNIWSEWNAGDENRLMNRWFFVVSFVKDLSFRFRDEILRKPEQISLKSLWTARVFIKSRKLFFADFWELFEFLFMIHKILELKNFHVMQRAIKYPSWIQTCRLTLSKRS